MTKREYFERVIALVGNDKEMVDFTNEQIALLDKKNESAKAKRLEKSIADEPLRKKIMEYLGNHSKALASELATTCEVSTSKIVAICKKMVDDELIKVEKVKIAKVGERNAYSLI